MTDHAQNPFPVRKYPPSPNGVVYDNNPVVGWKWYDETWCECERTYPTQREALRALLDYMDWLDNGPTLWQRVWWPIRYTLWPKVLEFIHS